MVGRVLLAEGGSKMSMIQSALENAFPGKLLIDDPDLAVAKGTALAERYLHDR
jgi:molecular chaperone DnaK (HSP70)